MVDTADIVKEGLNIENSELDLREKELTDADIIEIMKSDEMKSVTALFLEFNEIGDSGLQAVLECPAMKNLTVLNMFKNQVTDVGERV